MLWGTYEAKPPTMVKIMIYIKKGVGIGGLGNMAMVSMAKTAKLKRPQKAHIQGLRGLSPWDHLAAR